MTSDELRAPVDASRVDPSPVDASRVDAVILVGGKGTRLRPLTLSAPKPMLPTLSKPVAMLLLCWLDRLQRLLPRSLSTGMRFKRTWPL